MAEIGYPPRRCIDKVLIIGYGNPDREDDGVAWHILGGLAERLKCPEPTLDTDDLDHREGYPDLLCVLQLDPELAEVLADYDRVCFVDAHTGDFQEDIRVENLETGYVPTPFTHHVTPETCLMLAETLYGHTSQGILVSVRGYQFGFSHELSKATIALADVAIEKITSWLSS